MDDGGCRGGCGHFVIELLHCVDLDIREDLALRLPPEPVGGVGLEASQGDLVVALQY